VNTSVHFLAKLRSFYANLTCAAEQKPLNKHNFGRQLGLHFDATEGKETQYFI
jgi:hypothetical protein